ncbi:hypothetical protein EJ06DRAFT_533214 [Trichodelitschia bisporula]|uniref:endo-polygalacturonase n=1 Tax=Trichodelitschia bisporula TaxID=703511 RepID=A0A6G1HNW9_9PEZI|nr:hypothetical protein EJ06DRAFT_533214 [Trichodelitschia bisporula]
MAPHFLVALALALPISATLHPRQRSPTAASSCTVTAYADIPRATSSCTSIVLSALTIPPWKQIDLRKLKDGTSVTFVGKTVFQQQRAAVGGGRDDGDDRKVKSVAVDEEEPMIRLGGKDISLIGAPGSLLYGSGEELWDGIGSNPGHTVKKPKDFMKLNKIKGNSVVRGLHVQNWPVRLFSLFDVNGLVMEDLNLNNADGDKRVQWTNTEKGTTGSGTAAHNTDAFGLAKAYNITIRNSRIHNQDDCIAITSGGNILAENITCIGGHGLSIGSIGGKGKGGSDEVERNTVKGVIFRNSQVLDSQNGVRIKSNAGEKGHVENVTFENIFIGNATSIGVAIHQDYSNAKAKSGTTSNLVMFKDIVLTNVTGTASPKAQNYYVKCGDGSCVNFKWTDVRITGGQKDSCSATDANVEIAGNFLCGAGEGPATGSGSYDPAAKKPAATNSRLDRPAKLQPSKLAKPESSKSAKITSTKSVKAESSRKVKTQATSTAGITKSLPLEASRPWPTSAEATKGVHLDATAPRVESTRTAEWLWETSKPGML